MALQCIDARPEDRALKTGAKNCYGLPAMTQNSSRVSGFEISSWARFMGKILRMSFGGFET